MAKVVSTYGPRGYRPKYGILDDGTTVELYSGPLIPQSGSNEGYNDDFINISDANLPDFFTGKDSYFGKSDSERIVWLESEMAKMQTVAIAYANKIQVLAKGDVDLAKVTSAALVLVGSKILIKAPIVGGIVVGFGLVIKFLNDPSAKRVEAYKKAKITEWAGIIQGLQAQYLKYSDELAVLKTKNYLKIGLVLGIIAVLFYKRNG